MLHLGINTITTSAVTKNEDFNPPEQPCGISFLTNLIFFNYKIFNFTQYKPLKVALNVMHFNTDEK